MKTVNGVDYPRLHIVYENDPKEENYPRNLCAPCLGLVNDEPRFRFSHYKDDAWMGVDLNNPKSTLCGSFKDCCEWAWGLLVQEQLDKVDASVDTSNVVVAVKPIPMIGVRRAEPAAESPTGS